MRKFQQHKQHLSNQLLHQPLAEDPGFKPCYSVGDRSNKINRKAAGLRKRVTFRRRLRPCDSKSHFHLRVAGISTRDPQHWAFWCSLIEGGFVGGYPPLRNQPLLSAPSGQGCVIHPTALVLQRGKEVD